MMGAAKREAQSEFVQVNDWVWHAAMREMDPAPGPDLPYRTPLPQAYADYPRVLVQAVVDYLREDLMCDHQVNICMCGTQAVVEELLLNLNGKETCSGCGGEGFNWNQTKYEQAREIWLEGQGPERWYDMSDDVGYDPCEACDKRGVVAQQ